MSNTIKINGIMVGADCAVLSFVTTISPNTSIKAIAHYKTTAESTWHDVEGKSPDEYSIGITLMFRERTSAWEFDLTDLAANTFYEIYLTISSVESNHFTFKTLTNTGHFDYNLEFENYGPPKETWEPTPEQESAFRASFDNFSDMMEGIGFERSGFTAEFRVGSENTVSGWGAITSGGKIYLPKNFGKRVLVHEMRHLLGWSGSPAGQVGYIELTENGHKVISFFSMNNNRSEVYYYYGENSLLDLEPPMLYDYFILMVVNRQEVKILYESEEES